VGAAVGILILILPIPSAPKNPLPSIRQIPQKLDLVGFVLFAPAVVMILMAFQWGGSVYSWGSSVVIGLLVGGAVTFCVFLVWEDHRGATAMVPLRFLKERVIYCACLTGMLQQGALLVLSFYLPEYFQLVRGKTPTVSGVSILPTFISQIGVSVASGFLGK
jgi:hypothetical protein